VLEPKVFLQILSMMRWIVLQILWLLMEVLKVSRAICLMIFFCKRLFCEFFASVFCSGILVDCVISLCWFF
jgi:hypothetical protein